MLETREQVNRYDEGQEKEKTFPIFEDFKNDPTKVLKRSELTAARDCLIVEIWLANAHRSGVSVHMKMNEYKNNFLRRGFTRFQFGITRLWRCMVLRQCIWDQTPSKIWKFLPTSCVQNLTQSVRSCLLLGEKSHCRVPILQKHCTKFGKRVGILKAERFQRIFAWTMWGNRYQLDQGKKITPTWKKFNGTQWEDRKYTLRHIWEGERYVQLVLLKLKICLEVRIVSSCFYHYK